MTTSPTGTRNTATRATRTGRHARGGFTLLELVLVMILICTALAIAAPNLSGFFAGARQRDTAMQVTALLRWARTQAVSEGRVYRFNIVEGGKQYVVTYQDGEQFVQDEGTQFGQVYTAPDRVAVTLTRDDNTAGDHVDFFPDGRCETGTFKITLENRDDALVTCTTPTEQYRVVPPSELNKQ